MRRKPQHMTLALVLTGALVLAGCSEVTHEPIEDLPTYPATQPPLDEDPAPTPEPSPPVPEIDLVERVTVRTEVIATDLPAPWGMAVLPDAAVLLTLRDQAALVIVHPDGSKQPVTGPGAEDLAATTITRGEGGLLGLALAPDFESSGGVYVYRTTELDGEVINQVLRGKLTGTELSELTMVVGGIPGANVHNGGALAFGPDGMLYIGTGDASEQPLSQDPDSLAGKILRVTPQGDAAANNPIPDSPIWSLGHRNVQGFDWDVQGRMFASEFGQNEFDELNLIIAGANYGWPVTEGMPEAEAAESTRSPLHVWRPVEASPSGLAVTNEGVYLAGLRGEQLWRVTLGDLDAEPQSVLDGHGRLRNVTALTDGDLLVLTNNTDGRGTPGAEDDLLLKLTVT